MSKMTLELVINRNPQFVGARQYLPHPSGFINRILYYLIYRIHLGSFYGR